MMTAPGNRPSLAPRNWPGWVGVGFIWVLGKLPQRVGLWLSVPLAWALWALMRHRRRIAGCNIKRCFPAMGEAERRALLKACFRSLARTLFEIAWSWSAADVRILTLGHVEGLEHCLAAQRGGRGVLLVTAHMSCLEMGGRLLGQSMPAAGIYRPLRSPVLEWFQTRARLRYGTAMISKRDTRSAVRLLRDGGAVWYAPDQDFGREQSVFAPFFGIQTATLSATRRLAQMTGCAVVPMFPVYDVATRLYTLRILPALESFPSDDPVVDLGRINRIMETHIRAAPEQYWWIHRRFKTRPEGEPPFYAD